MKLIIDIKDEQYKAVQDGWWCGSLYEELKNGIPVEHCGDCISREKALQIIRDWFDREAAPSDLKNEIEQLQSVTPQPCEDAVSRQELLKAISTWDKFGCDTDTKLVPYKDHYVPYIHYDDVINCIKCMPSVSAQPKMGHWIEENKGLFGIYPRCSKCNELYHTKEKYCPNCGAKMESED